MIIIILAAYMAFFARLAGAGAGSSIWPSRPGGSAELLFALPFGIAFFWHVHCPFLALLAVIWSFAWMQTGHNTAYSMGVDTKTAQSGVKHPLSYVVDPICRVLRQPLGGIFYSWLFMGLKGLLIHLPLGLWALPAAALWPFCYFVGNWIIPKLPGKLDGEVIAEAMTGIFAGILVTLSF